jgi:hypothetical protein
MKIFIIMIVVMTSFLSISYCGDRIKGYTRKDGTYVNGYFRSDKNSTVQDNYSHKGNFNPYTGQNGSDYDRDNRSSEYYGTLPQKSAYNNPTITSSEDLYNIAKTQAHVKKDSTSSGLNSFLNGFQEGRQQYQDEQGRQLDMAIKLQKLKLLRLQNGNE